MKMYTSNQFIIHDYTSVCNRTAFERDSEALILQEKSPFHTEKGEEKLEACHPTLSARGTKGVGALGTAGDGVAVGTGVSVGVGSAVGTDVGVCIYSGAGAGVTALEAGSTAEEKSRLCVCLPAAPSTVRP